MIITREHIKQISPRIKARTLEVLPFYLNDLCSKYRINTFPRLAAFLAQTAHESAGFNRLEENLNYRAERLLEVFERYFPDEALAQDYAGNPEAIANRVYANRMGNGPESSGDGWRYRGRGIMMVTGKNNYARVSRQIYGDESVLLNNPDFLAAPVVAVQAACIYWQDNGLNEIADKPVGWTIEWKKRKLTAFEYITVLINGGLNGLDDRLLYWRRAKKALSA